MKNLEIKHNIWSVMDIFADLLILCNINLKYVYKKY